MLYFDSNILTALPLWSKAAFGFVIGAVIGSYLATILWRWPIGQSASHGRSRCDACQRRLAWFEIIPLIGRALARGRCSACGRVIGWQHTQIESACALLGALCFAAGVPWLAPLAWILTLLAWFDARFLWLPNKLVASAAIFALAATPLTPQPLVERLIGGGIGFGTLWGIATVYRRFRGREGLGGGDAKLFGAIGLWVGPLNLPMVLLIACALGLADVAARHLRKHDLSSVKLPLGLYLAISTNILVVKLSLTLIGDSAR